MKRKQFPGTLWLIMVILAVLCIATSLAESNRSITISGSDHFVMAGKNMKLTATVTSNSEDAPRKTALIWESADSGIAKVANGTVTGISAGTTIIKAYAKDDPSVCGEYNIEVRTPVKSIDIDPPKLQLMIGSTEEQATALFHIRVLPEDAYYQDVKWISSDENIINIAKDGKVTALAKGKAKITVVSEEPESKVKAVATVSVEQAVEQINIDETSVSLVAGKKIAVKATVLPEDAKNKKLEWVSNDESIASVNSKGQITGINGGKTTIVAKATDGSGIETTINVKVIKPVLQVSVDSQQYDYGKTVKLIAKLTNSDGTIDGVEELFPDAAIYAVLQTANGKNVSGFIEQGRKGLSFDCDFPLSADNMAAGEYKILVQSNVEKLKAYTDVFYYTADKSWLPPLDECSVELTLSHTTVNLSEKLLMTAMVTDKESNPVPGIKVGFRVLTIDRKSTQFFGKYRYIWNTTEADGKSELICTINEKRAKNWKAGKYIVQAFIVDAAGMSEKELIFTGE